MSSSGFLVPPTEDPSKEKLWVETWKRLDRFLPDLRKELDLDPKEEAKEAVKEEQVAVAPIEKEPVVESAPAT